MTAMRTCIHRGANQIGGSCVELESQGKRLLLDLGLPLDAEQNHVGLLPKVQGLLEPSDSLLGVIVSHPHMDHYGLLGHARPDLPVAMGAAGRRILEAAAPWMPKGSRMVPNPGLELKDLELMEWGPFRITPYLVDHSAFDSYALLIEADGRRLFYSGDFRAHGRTPWRFNRLVEQPPKGVHKLLMEGSSLGRLGMDEQFQTEAELEEEMVQAVKATQGFALVCASAQNIDRIVTLVRLAKKCRRRLVIDLYTAAVLEATGHTQIPQSDWKDVALYTPDYQVQQIKNNKWFELLDRHKKNRIFPNQLAAKASKSVLLMRYAHQHDLVAANALKGAKLFYSMWVGYLKKDSGIALQDWADTHDVPMEVLHTSGHASPTDLKRFVTAMNPDALVPVHTFQPERYVELFPRVEMHGDGEWWEA
jgi:ribonuclease J